MIDKKLSLRNRNKLLIGVFDDGDKILDTVKTIKSSGVDIMDCYTPYPIHHLDKAMGLKATNLSVAAFIFGFFGFLAAGSLQYYTMKYDWEMIIHNKPSAFIPSWMPVFFELTVLCTAFGMVATFFIRNRMLHGIKPELLDLRQTDDLMLIAIEVKDGVNESEVLKMYKNGGAIELRERNGGIQTTIN